MKQPKLKLDRLEWYRRLDHTPRRGQAAVDAALDDGYRFVAFFAFPRAGKSFGAARSTGLYLLQPDWHMWIVAPTYPLGSKEFGYIWQDLNQLGYLQWADAKRGGRRAFDTRSGHMFIEFPWGSFLKVVSADNPTSLRAEELDMLVLAEASALPADVYGRHLFARTAKRKGITLVPTTPMGKNWIYDMFRVPSRRLDLNGNENELHDPRFWSCVVSADPDLVSPLDWDCADIFEPGVYEPEEVEIGKKKLPPAIYQEQFGGGFASYAGRVLPYDPRNHRCEPFEIPDHWTHVIGWDHGSSPSETAILVGSYDPRGTIYWWAELYTTGWTAQEYWAWVQRTLGPNKAVSLVSVDPSAKQLRIELGSLNPPVSTNIPHDKQIEAGIIRLTQLLNLNHFKVFRDACPNFEREMMRMEWDEKNPKKILNDHVYHACSAARYATLVTVPLPDDPTPPEFTKVLEENPKAYWAEQQRHKHKTYWREIDKRFDDQRALDEQFQLEDTVAPDILSDIPEGELGVADFDPEAYWEE